MKTIIIGNGTELHFDDEKWILSNEPICKIVGEDETNYILQNKNGSESSIPKEIIQVNEIEIKDNTVILTPSLYEHHILKKIRSKPFDYSKIFKENADLIFRNKEIVMSKAEYYLLTPPILDSAGAYIGGVDYNLGSLLEVWEKPSDFYFAEFDDHKDMYLICTHGSPLSGINQKYFWCEDEGKLIKYGFNGPFPKNDISFAQYVKFFKIAMKDKTYIQLDFQDVIMEQLLAEIASKSLDRNLLI